MDAFNQYLGRPDSAEIPSNAVLQALIRRYPWFTTARIVQSRISGKIDPELALRLTVRPVPAILLRSVGPVSYTHLDVYKRQDMGIAVNIYLEDWSNGMIHSPEYVYAMMDALKDQPIRRFMIPDTLGILNPDNTFAFCSEMVRRYPNVHFDFHAHNDYDLAVANVLAAVKAGVHGVHTTINGLGERAGNAPLSSVIAVLNDQLKCPNGVVERKINHVSRVVETYTGVRIPPNRCV